MKEQAFIDPLQYRSAILEIECLKKSRAAVVDLEQYTRLECNRLRGELDAAQQEIKILRAKQPTEPVVPLSAVLAAVDAENPALVDRLSVTGYGFVAASGLRHIVNEVTSDIRQRIKALGKAGK